MSSNNKRPQLPLEWTKVKRYKPNNTISSTNKINNSGSELTVTNNNTNDYDLCCEDPACLFIDDIVPPSQNSRFGYQETESKNSTIHVTNEIKNVASTALINDDGNDVRPEKMRTLEGKAVFCLHEIDCKWFQGHFVPSHTNSCISSSKSPIGLLAVERSDTDDCVQCANGGYRELDMTLLLPTNNKNNITSACTSSDASNSTSVPLNRQDKKRKQVKVDKLICTGGDMLRIRTSSLSKTGSDMGDAEADDERGNSAMYASLNGSKQKNKVDISFDAERIITGGKVQPLVQRYFSNLAAKVLPPTSSSSSISANTSILDVLPDCAIVVGDMRIIAPAHYFGSSLNNGRNNKKNVDESDGGWMSD